GSITAGRSRLRVESGQATIQLDDDSDAAIYAEAQLGRIIWALGKHGVGGRHVLRGGTGRLDVGVVMGQVTIGAKERANHE
ncbi:MAG: hypothetical protein LBU38_02790, partial [Propionibacteriaceae bacterium]|nr:hypothetical protein [Propionibacteriaceae bacterium]